MTDDVSRVLLVDDDPLVCQGLELMLGQAPDLQIVGSVHDGDEVVTAIHQHHPDVILMDVRMQRVGGIEAVAAVRGRPNPPRILMLTTFDHDDVMMRAVGAGVDGFLLKTSSPTQILDAVRNVAAGESVLSPRSARQLLDHVQRGAIPGRNDARQRLQTLTRRELEVAQAVAKGATNAQIAGWLFASEATVKSHLRSALDKLGLGSRVELAVLVT
ncbi:response regulator [Leekyejoonella antrihumi]|uniref:Response regulator transcription factor n=1 Tax=Leekyejoonella antrihumi TaxID=1660198 RepID=A0A563E6R8_9MICO|nr:response regulator transcription factor [Leekyejoonella antrihumi]TWP38197.1 response regulator transcription factor [Leekyejoonella antrihumi]